MITDSFDVFTADISFLKDQTEIENYISSRLSSHHPSPECLIYDYTVFKRGANQSALVCFAEKEIIDSQGKELFHPFLLFKKKFRKDGLYVIYWEKQIIQIIIDRGLIQEACISHYTGEMYHRDPEIRDSVKKVLITDDMEPFISGEYDSHVTLEKASKGLKPDLFIPKKQAKSLKFLLTLLFLSSLVYGGIQLLNIYTDTILKEALLQSELADLTSMQVNRKKSSMEADKNKKEFEYLKSMQSADIYTLFSEIKRYSRGGLKIVQFSYRNTDEFFLEGVTKNALWVIDNLNKSDFLEVTPENITPMEDNQEYLNLKGRVLCP